MGVCEIDVSSSAECGKCRRIVCEADGSYFDKHRGGVRATDSLYLANSRTQRVGVRDIDGV